MYFPLPRPVLQLYDVPLRVGRIDERDPACARNVYGNDLADDSSARCDHRVSGGFEAALDAFEVTVKGLVAADVGASTGGFTDCLLQRGAQRVYAIDVGYGQLAWSLRQDDRVVVMERTNARYVTGLPETVDIVTADVSFISLGLIIPVAVRWLQPSGQVVALIKPQFEAGRREVGKVGVVRDSEVHRAVLRSVLAMASPLPSMSNLNRAPSRSFPPTSIQNGTAPTAVGTPTL